MSPSADSGRPMRRGDEAYQAYVAVLREELVPAMGCTEPIAVAYAAALARELTGGVPDAGWEKAKDG